MSKQQNLFKARQWLGTFHAPNEIANRFSGILKYSPENGVLLSYLVSGPEQLSSTGVLHGVLDDGSKCTLFGDFSTIRGGTAFQYGHTIHCGNAGFYFATMGDFHTDQTTVSSISIVLTGMQEFFYPMGFSDSLKFSEKPVFKAETPFGTIEVGHGASFRHVDEDLRSFFHCNDEEALNELQEAYVRIASDHKDARFLLKREISFRLRLSFADNILIRDALKSVESLSSLFSLLLNAPCHPEELSIIREGGSYGIRIEPIYPSIGLNERTIELSLAKRSHHSLPINAKRVNFEDVAKAWFEADGQFDTLVGAIQHTTGALTQHAVLGNILMFATQLESIAYKEGHSKKDKYSYSIESHAVVQLQESLQRLLNVNNLVDLGNAIATLRNEITHVGRPRKLLKKLPKENIFRISLCLELVVIGYVLDSIRVPIEAREHYQCFFMPRQPQS